MSAELPLCHIHHIEFKIEVEIGCVFDEISYGLTADKWGVYLRMQTGDQFLLGDFLTLPLAIAYAEALQTTLLLPIRYHNGEVIFPHFCE